MQTFKDSLKSNWKKVKNTIDGANFNRNAHEESSKWNMKYADPDTGEHNEWEKVTMELRTDADSDEGDYSIEEGPGPVERMVAKLSEQALQAAAEAAGVSKDYALVASKYIVMEVARDVGWAVNCKTALDAIRSVQTRFPLLVEIKNAYDEGSLGIPARIPGQQLLLTNYVRTHPPVAGVYHPHHISGPSNLDDFPIIRDDDIRDDVAYRRGRPLSVVERGRQLDREDFVLPNRGASAETYTTEERERAASAFDSDYE